MRTAVIGLGVIGDVHSKVLKEQNVNVVALCDIDDNKIMRVQENFFPAAQGFVDWKRMIDEVVPDVVHICTPHYLHTEMIIYCLNKDVNVLCEKPLCIKEEDIRLILRAEQASKAQLGVCFQQRYNPINLYVKDYLKDKEIVGGYGAVVWHKDENYYNAGAWRGTKAQEGGGTLINQAIHTLDLLEWMIGEPSFVTAKVDTLTLGNCIEVEDSAMCVFEGAGNFTLFATNSSITSFPIQVMINTKTDYIQFTPNSLTINNEIINFKRSNNVLGKAYYGTWHEELIADFYDCVVNDKKFKIDGAEAGKVVKLVLAAYKSNGKKIRID